MNEELLINIVQGYSCLYDLKDPHYDDQQRRDNIWKEIEDIVKEPAKTCRDKWRRIRDNYRRAKKLRKTKSGQAATNIRKAKYEDLLSFLNPYITNEDETFSNFPPNDDAQNSTYEDDINSRDRPGSSASQTTGRNRPSAKKRNSRSLDTPPQISPTHALLQQYLEKKYSAKKENSEKIVDFFKNLGETVSNFPEDIQIRVKREVFKIVTDAEELICRNQSEQQYVFELSEERAPPRIVTNSTDIAQPQNEFITPTSPIVVISDSNDIDTHEEIGLDVF